MDQLEQQINQVANAILEDYALGRDIDRLDTGVLPNRDAVIALIHKLQRIVFPGYFMEKSQGIYNFRHNLSLRIEDVLFQMREQIALVLRGQGEEEAAAQSHAHELSIAFLQTIPQVRGLVQTDVQAAFDGDPAARGKDEIIFSYPGVFAIMVYRLAHVLWQLQVPMLPRMMTEHAHSVTGIDIHPGATIAESFFIDHGTGIVIGETTIIGKNVKIYQGVTLGGLSTRGGQSLQGTKRHPTIEDNVTIYAGASILGGDTVIGANTVVGANAFITTSVAPHTTVTPKSQDLQYKLRKCSGCEAPDADCPFNQK